jgi:Bacterial Ig-like domain (group 3)/MBG domain (YGX type)
MKLNKIVEMLALGAALSAGIAHAVTVNVDFGAPPGHDYTGVGVAPDPGTTWNSFNSGGNGNALSPTNAALVDSLGGASSVQLSLTGAGGTWSAPAVNDLLFDYVWVNGGVGTVSLTGLAPNQFFELYLYGQGDNPAQNSKFTLGVANGGLSGISPASDRSVMANTYVKLAGTADGSGNVTFTWQAAVSGFAGFNGFQLDLNPPIDTTPPTLVSFEHDKGAGPILVNEPVTYTVTFSEAMASATVNTDDFGNASATATTINSVTATANPAVFTVVATSSEAGTLQLQINSGATLTDFASLALDAASAIPDDSTLTVNDLPKTLTTISAVSSGSPTTYGQTVTFTATVSPIPSGGTVQFYNGFVELDAPVAVNTSTGEASFSTNTLAVGSYEINAEYSGNFGFEASTTTAPTAQAVDKAPLTVKATNTLRPLNTANPDPFAYQITGFQNGENLASSGVSGLPVLTTTAVLSSPAGTYDITCGLGGLAADNYSFSLVNGTLTVADVANMFSVNFFVGPSWPFGGLTTDEEKENVKVAAGVPAGLPGTWFTNGWQNFEVPWGGDQQPLATLTSNKGSSATFNFKSCRNGYTYNGPRGTLLGDGNGNMMDAHVNSTLSADVTNHIFDMEVTDIPFAKYDVIFYLGANQPQFGDGTGVIKFNGGAERVFTLQPGAFDGTFTEMVDAVTPGNYVVFSGVTGSSFTTQTWGTGAGGFNHIGPFGFQIKEVPAPANSFTSWANDNNAVGQTPDQDHDNDGVDNGVEYFMGQTGSSFTALPSLDGSNNIAWTMDPAYQGTYEVQTSPDLVNWTNVDPKPAPSGGTLSYTLPPGALGGKSFVRLLVTPTP